MTGIYVRGQLIETDIPIRDETVLKQSQPQESGQSHRGRADSARQIMEQLYTSDRPMTRLEILKSVHRSKSPHLIAMLEQMVADGLIVRHEQRQRNGMRIYFYEPNR